MQSTLLSCAARSVGFLLWADIAFFQGKGLNLSLTWFKQSCCFREMQEVLHLCITWPTNLSAPSYGLLNKLHSRMPDFPYQIPLFISNFPPKGRIPLEGQNHGEHETCSQEQVCLCWTRAGLFVKSSFLWKKAELTNTGPARRKPGCARPLRGYSHPVWLTAQSHRAETAWAFEPGAER